MDLTTKIKNLPNSPGVYRFLNKDKEILYVGKSKNLRNRVRSYFTGTKEGKIARLVQQIHDLEVEVCDTHLEARLLECRRIKEIRPPYNAQFKRERGFVYLRIGQNPRQSALAIVTDPALGLGPFRNRRLLESVLADFPKLYPLTVSSPGSKGPVPDAPPDGRPLSRKGSRSRRIDWTYSLLPRRLDAGEYAANRAALEGIFRERALWERFMKTLERAMHEAAAAEAFSQAIFYRDFLERLRLLYRLLTEDQELFRSLLFLRIPTDGGIKYFRICHGTIEDSAPAADPAGGDFESFCRDSTVRRQPDWRGFSERARSDFLDILYSEIRSLPPEQIQFG